MEQVIYGDAELRAAFHKKKLARYKPRPDVLVVDELGLAHARSRVDIAVINGSVHGYEIKSGKDTLERFPLQLETYRKTLGHLTVVCASKHLSHIIEDAPDWCGVVEALDGARGAIHFATHRKARPNPELDAIMLAHLLWRDEAVTALSAHGVSRRELRKPRRELYEMIADRMTPKEITALIRNSMLARRDWRDRPEPESYDD